MEEEGELYRYFLCRKERCDEGARGMRGETDLTTTPLIEKTNCLRLRSRTIWYCTIHAGEVTPRDVATFTDQSVGK